jgi:hypothetical protein
MTNEAGGGWSARHRAPLPSSSSDSEEDSEEVADVRTERAPQVASRQNRGGGGGGGGSGGDDDDLACLLDSPMRD